METRKEIRILATAHDYRPRLGGVATLCFGILRAMAALPGVQVRLITPTRKGGAEFDASSGIDTLRVKVPSESTRAVRPYAAHLAREISTWKPDVILNFLWQPCGTASLITSLLRFLNPVPYFLFAHAVEVVESKSTLKKRIRGVLTPLKQRVFSGARRVFAVSSFTQGLLKRFCRLPDEKITIVHPGFDPAEFFPEPPAEDLVKELGLRGKKVFLTVTRLEDYKGVDRAISAISQVIRVHPEVVYLVCGEGPDRKRLDSLVRHYRVQDKVKLLGAVPGGRLRDFYNLSDAFVLLSREDWEKPNMEGFGIVFIEAAACGKPSIGGRSGGIPDAVDGDEFGWLVDPQNPQAIAAAMMQVIADPEYTRKKGEAARKRALEGFTWKHMAETVVERIRAEVGGHVRN